MIGRLCGVFTEDDLLMSLDEDINVDDSSWPVDPTLSRYVLP